MHQIGLVVDQLVQSSVLDRGRDHRLVQLEGLDQILLLVQQFLLFFAEAIVASAQGIFDLSVHHVAP